MVTSRGHLCQRILGLIVQPDIGGDNGINMHRLVKCMTSTPYCSRVVFMGKDVSSGRLCCHEKYILTNVIANKSCCLTNLFRIWHTLDKFAFISNHVFSLSFHRAVILILSMVIVFAYYGNNRRSISSKKMKIRGNPCNYALNPYETHGPSDVVDNSITCYHGLMHRTESTTIYTPRNEVRGVNWIHPVCLSVCMSVCPSVCLLTFRVRPVASTVQDGFFPYLVQMINSMGGCVACDNPWPWPISSRSFGLDLENRVRSVASTVLNGFFLYLAQMITIIRRCVGWYVFVVISKFECLANF